MIHTLPTDSTSGCSSNEISPATAVSDAGGLPRRILRQQFLHNFSVYVRQAEVAASMAVGKTFMVKT